MTVSAVAPSSVVVTDANILINLFHIGRLALLGELPPLRFMVPQEVCVEVAIHRPDGTIRDSDSDDRDPNPPKGQETLRWSKAPRFKALSGHRSTPRTGGAHHSFCPM